MSISFLNEEVDAAREEVVPEQLLEVEDEPCPESIDGKPVARYRGAKASEVVSNTIVILREHVHLRQLGKVLAQCGYRCFSWSPRQVWSADVSFVARGRLPEEKTPDGEIPIHPDLVVAIVSPNDRADEIEGRRADFLRAGARLFWAIYPRTRTMHVFRQDGSATFSAEDDDLGGEDVLPGFLCKIAAFFEGL